MPALFADIDWSRTRAYGLGLNGLYINLRGREASGIVDPAHGPRWCARSATSCCATIDPATGTPAVTRVFRREEAYTLTGNEDIAPGHHRRLREGHAGVGRIGARRRAGRGHGGQPRGVERGPLHGPRRGAGHPLDDRPLRTSRRANLRELAAALLAELDIEGFPSTDKEH